MNNKIKKIRELNDNLRQNFSADKVMVTRCVADLHQNAQIEKFDLKGKRIVDEEKK